ncbi:MAG: cell wall-binding repeat-containing protein, partial [Porphyromonadaceae bacterium]|nr:cell wall-binding repeat-containing protein [Porphyromonadaceae bacterium]
LWQQMFHNNAKIKEVVIDGKNATNFSQNTFPNIEELLITGEETNFPAYKFGYETSTLKKVDIDVKNYSSESGSFRYASALELFRLKADSAKFDNRAFYECPSLKVVDLTKCKKVEYSEGTFGTGVTNGQNNSPMNSKAVIYVKDTSDNPRTSGVETGLSDKHGIVAITNGGTFDNTIKIEEGKLSTPTKDGYIFKGWYDNTEFKNEAITSFEVGKTYYAKWEEAVASVDGVVYTDLQTAINNAAGKTVTIEKNIALTNDLEITGNNVTIDFNGKTLSSDSGYKDKSLIKITNSTGITIKDANLDLSNGGDVAILVTGTSKVSLQGNITSKKNNSDKAPVISLVGENAKAELTKGSKINGKSDPDSELIITDENSKNNFTNGNNTSSGGGSVPSKPSKPTYTHEKIEGLDRYETAAKIADKLGSYDTAVLVNATSTMSDGLSAAGLAGKEDAAILLVKKDSIPKATMDRIKKVKKVYIVGGESAISAKVANEITAAGVKVERLGGKTRVETSELVAKEIGNYSNAFVVNGFKGEADAMSASSIAARYEAPILLTNG